MEGTAAQRARVVVEMSEPLLEATDKAAAELEMSRSDVIRGAVKQYVTEHQRRKLEKELEEGYVANAESARAVANDMMEGESGL